VPGVTLAFRRRPWSVVHELIDESTWRFSLAFPPSTSRAFTHLHGVGGIVSSPLIRASPRRASVSWHCAFT
jgi:hypothetical protein